jgi:hypothetical protein
LSFKLKKLEVVQMSLASMENCAVCGTELLHRSTPVATQCAYCGVEEKTLIYCPDGHYVCDSCHRSDAIEMAATMLHASASTSPSELLEMLMSHPSVPMHGPEHHSFVPAVLVTAVRNTGHPVPEGAIEEAIRRGSKVPGGWCGYYGVCGAGAGLGIAVSILTGATPVKGYERGLVNEATSLALMKIADGYPRCCKRAARKALEVGIEYMQERLGITLVKSTPTRCRFYLRNRECPMAECLYHPNYQSSDSIKG